MCSCIMSVKVSQYSSVATVIMRSDYTIEYGMFNLMTVFIELIGGADNTHA